MGGPETHRRTFLCDLCDLLFHPPPMFLCEVCAGESPLDSKGIGWLQGLEHPGKRTGVNNLIACNTCGLVQEILPLIKTRSGVRKASP